MSELLDAIEAKRGLPYDQILAELKAETVDVVGPIEGKDLRDVVTVLCSGLDYRLSQVPDSPLKTSLVRAFNSMSINEFGFNLADPLVAQLLDAGVEAGLVDVNERLWFYGIATKQVPKYPELTMETIVAYLDSSKMDGEWHELPETLARRFKVDLHSDAPGPTYIVVQMSQEGSPWFHATAIHGIHKARPYFGDVPLYGVPRKFRWKCVYALDATVTVV